MKKNKTLEFNIDGRIYFNNNCKEFINKDLVNKLGMWGRSSASVMQQFR